MIHAVLGQESTITYRLERVKCALTGKTTWLSVAESVTESIDVGLDHDLDHHGSQWTVRLLRCLVAVKKMNDLDIVETALH